ncbi:MAG: hypothetical protein Q9170_000823 [Blastenia crenularia]
MSQRSAAPNPEGAQTEEHHAIQHRQSAPSRSGDENLLPPPVIPRQNGFGPSSHRACLSDTPATTAPNSPRMPPRRQDSGLSSSSTRSRPTTLDIPGLTKSKVSPDGRIAQRDVGSKLVIVMVGLPARGKSYVTKKMARYLNWLQHDTKIFNVGEKRRVAAGGPTKHLASARPSDTSFPDMNARGGFTTASLGHVLHQNPPLDSPSPQAHVLVNGEQPLDQLGDTDLPPPALDVLGTPAIDIWVGADTPHGHDDESSADTNLASKVNHESAQDQMDQSANFFDPDNIEAAGLREQLAIETLDELLEYLLDQNGSVGIFDATNSTLDRRKNIMNKIRQRAGPELGVLFLESQCIDETLLESNMRLKLSGPDYKDRDPVKALADFKQRVALYEKAYVPLGEYEERNNMSYVQMIDVGRKVVSHQIRGFLSAQTVYYLLNFNLSPRQIWITRHGESKDNISGKIGGDSDLSPAGLAYAKALTRFIKSERRAWDIRQQDKVLSTHFPPQPGDTTPPNPEYIAAAGDDEHPASKSFCVWTSMLKRSIQTAQFFDEDDFEIKQMRMLDELNSGAMEGLTYDEIKAKHPEEYEIRRNDKLHYRYPGAGGESYLDIINRLRAVIVEVERMTDHVLLVGHRSVARVLLAYFKGLKREEVADLDVPLGTLYMLEPQCISKKVLLESFRIGRVNSMEETASLKSAGTSVSAGTKRKRAADPKFYAVRIGHQPGIYHTWADCLEQVKGFKKALFKSFPTLTDAERFLAGENLTTGGTSSSSLGGKFYAVKSGRVPGIYTDWPSAQEQITGWQKPKHRSFATRAEAQRFLDQDGPKIGDSPEATEVESTPSINQQPSENQSGSPARPPAPKKAKKTLNGTSKSTKSAAVEYNEADHEPGTGPLPPGAEDGFDPNIMLDATSGKVVYKTLEQRQATKPNPTERTRSGTLRIHTDGSSLRNGATDAFAGVGVYFGPGDARNVSETLPGLRQTNQRAELTAILRALEIVPKNLNVSIITDSKYGIDCVTVWYINWKKNGWKTSAGKAVENKDLVENILAKIEERESLGAQTAFEWIKGHANNPGNVEADRLAVEGAIISMLAGVVLSPHASNFVRPLEYARGSEYNLDAITLDFSRLVLGVQLVIAGVQLPSKYLRHEWKSLSLLLGPGMTAMWVTTSLLVWGMVPNLSFLHALAVGACVTPTDPVLSSSIVKGKFADANVPKDLQRIIIAESGTNDGLGYPFLFFALYLIKYVGSDGAGQPGGARLAMGYWFGESWGYTIILGALYGAAVGWIAKELLHWAERKGWVDRESFLVFAVALALFTFGTCGMIGSDDVLACFIAGNVFNWDDWFRSETDDDSLQPTLDMLLNISVFAWYGAVCPWPSFAHSDVIPVYRLIFLGVLVLLLRRIPMVFALHWKIWQIQDIRQMLFAGYFGPIGVSAIFYLFISVDFLEHVTVDGEVREDAARLQDVIRVIVWFLVMCSIVGHGLSVPLGKVGYHLPRTLSGNVGTRADEDPEEPSPPEPFHIRDRMEHEAQTLRQREHQRKQPGQQAGLLRRILHFGDPNIQSSQKKNTYTVGDASEEASADSGPTALEKQNASPAPVRSIHDEDRGSDSPQINKVPAMNYDK